RHQGGTRGGGGRGGVIHRQPGYSRAGRRRQRPRRAREDNMKIMIVWFATTMALAASPAHAEDGALAVPHFEVDAFGHNPPPNNWTRGRLPGTAPGRSPRMWAVHRPPSLPPRGRRAEQSPPEPMSCAAAPPVLVFAESGNLLRHWRGAGDGFQWPQSE